ncbi:protein BIC1 [Mangifera indica]|uniref:protein BIC1 n=1 Tax=Mangifera indica TaxID=29780 RepID=UPI001CF9DDEE|nr:protein BIC1 [Mangifera indica]
MNPTDSAATFVSRSNKTHQMLEEFEAEAEDNGRERLKRHIIEVAGHVWIPGIWGQEEMLKDWIDCTTFDACLVSAKIISARSALVQEGRKPNSPGLRIVNRC